jgi:hypothetical protein
VQGLCCTITPVHGCCNAGCNIRHSQPPLTSVNGDLPHSADMCKLLLLLPAATQALALMDSDTKKLIRAVVRRVHPDLFTAHPFERQRNSDSLKVCVLLCVQYAMLNSPPFTLVCFESRGLAAQLWQETNPCSRSRQHPH